MSDIQDPFAWRARAAGQSTDTPPNDPFAWRNRVRQTMPQPQPKPPAVPAAPEGEEHPRGIAARIRTGLANAAATVRDAVVQIVTDPIESVPEVVTQGLRGLAEGAYATGIGVTNILKQTAGPQTIPDDLPGGAEIIAPQNPIAAMPEQIRAEREVMREVVGEPETPAGKVAQFGGRAAFEVAQAGLAGAGVQATGVLPQATGTLGKIAAGTAATAPIDVAVASAPEESMAGAVASLLPESEVAQKVAENPALRILAEVATSAVGEGIIEGGLKGARAAKDVATPKPKADATPAPKERLPFRRRIAEMVDPSLTAERRTGDRVANTDELTGVANRRAYDAALPAAETDPNTAVVAFDANNFGQVNKKVSQEAGDAAIKDVADAIKKAAEEFGVGERVFRRGGDEFVVLAPRDVAEQVRARAERIYGIHEYGPVEVSVSGTVGNTFNEADATLQARKAERKAAKDDLPRAENEPPPEQKLETHDPKRRSPVIEGHEDQPPTRVTTTYKETRESARAKTDAELEADYRRALRQSFGEQAESDGAGSPVRVFESVHGFGLAGTGKGSFARGRLTQATSRMAAIENELRARGLETPHHDTAFNDVKPRDLPVALRDEFAEVPSLKNDELVRRLREAEVEQGSGDAMIRRAYLAGEVRRRGIDADEIENLGTPPAELPEAEGPPPRSPEEQDIDELVGVETAPEPEVKRAVPAGHINLSGIGEAVRKLARRNFTARGNMPERAFARNVEREGWISAQERQIKYTVDDYDRAVKEVFGGKGPSEPDLMRLDNALKGGSLDGVDARLQPVVRQMREEIDVLSRRMVDSGMIEGDLAGAIEDNIGTYATRSYRKFDDPEWAEKVPEDVRNRAKAWLRGEYPDLSNEEIAGKLEALLYEKDAPIAVLAGGGKVGSKDLTSLMRRKDIPEEIRALWGEYRDPKVNYARSVTKMAHLIANDKFLKDVLREGLDGGYLHAEPIVRDGVKYIEEVAAEGSKALAPLNGIYTTPEIAQAFRDAVDPQTPGPWWLRTWMKGVGTVKVSKIVLSPMAQVRNMVGNIGFAVANGHFRPGAALEAAKAIAADLGMKSLADTRTYYKELAELGVVGQSARAAELREILHEAAKNYDNVGDGIVAELAKKVGGGAARAYELGDDVWKVFAFENEVRRYSKALPDKSLAEVKRIAAENVANTYPTYSRVPRAVRALRRFPAVGTFVSFPAEVVRTGFNTLELAAKELKDPALRAIGAQRAVGIVLAGAAVPTMAIASRHMLGLTEDDTESLRRFMPPWARNSNLFFLQRPEAGKVEYIDLSYTDPYNYLRKPAIALLRGEDWKESLWEATVEMAQPFFGEDVLFEKVTDVRRNKKRAGGNVFNPQDAWTDQQMDKLAHLWGAFEPGAVTSGRRIAKAAKGEVSNTGRSYDLDNELLALGTGFRVQEVDVPEALRFRARDFVRNRSDAARILNQVVTRRGTVTDKEIEQAFASSHRARTELFETMHEDVLGARKLGVPDKDIRDILVSAGVSRGDAQAVIDGRYRAPQSTALDDMDATNREEGDELRRRKKAVGALLRGAAQKSK